MNCSCVSPDYGVFTQSFTDISSTVISATVIVPCNSFFVKCFSERNNCYLYPVLPSYEIDRRKYCWLFFGILHIQREMGVGDHDATYDSRGNYQPAHGCHWRTACLACPARRIR